MADPNGHAVKILRVNESAECEIISENLSLVHEELKKSGAELVSIVSVMGSYRTGKSFLLDLLLRRMRAAEAEEKRREGAQNREAKAQEAGNAGHNADTPEVVGLPRAPAEPPDEPEVGGAPEPEQTVAEPDWQFRRRSPSPFLPGWFREGDQGRVAEGVVGRPEEGQGFAWRPGEHKCTDGIWLWSRPFVFTDSCDRKIGVLLMDTQGAFDSTLSKSQSSTVFGLTALLSAKLVYNVQNKLDDNMLDHFDYVTTFAQNACSLLQSSRVPFGQLHFLVRDWAHYKDGFTMEECRKSMEDHLARHTSPERLNNENSQEMAKRLRGAFVDPIRCSGLCHPGLHVTHDGFAGEIDEIDPNFFKLLDDFTNQLIKVDFPQASAPNGTVLTVGNFHQFVTNYAGVFRESANKAVSLRDAYVTVDLMDSMDELVGNFEKQLFEFAPKTLVVDPNALSLKSEELSTQFKNEFARKLRPYNLSDSEAMEQMEKFTKIIQKDVSSRMDQNKADFKMANYKLIASPVVGGVVYFLYMHHVVLAVCAVSGTVVYLRRKQKTEKERRGEEVCIADPQIMQGMVVDAKGFGKRRRRDMQGIWVVVNNFNANEVMEQIANDTSGARATVARVAVGSAAAEMVPRAQR